MSQVITITLEVPDGVTVAVATTSAEAAPVAAAPGETVATRKSDLGTTERTLLDQLAETHGRHLDRSGRATTQLIDLAGCDSMPAAKQALVRLAERGLIEREIQGKRCYRIALTREGWAAAKRSRP